MPKVTPKEIPISGFTVIRNAVRMGYPVLESIRSILPIVDEMVVGVGQSDDGTKELLASLADPKLKVFDAFWDTNKTKGGLILSEKTNEALDRCQHDWCFYIQADEVVHENDLPIIYKAVQLAGADPELQGLLFRYIHFYGSYDVIATSRKWYRNEVRIVRRSCGIRSVNDAQGFRVFAKGAETLPAPAKGERPLVMPSGGRIFHYGWVKPPTQMGEKSKLLSRWWHGTKKDNEFTDFKYDRQYGLRPFLGDHPRIMQELVAKQNWNFNADRSLTDWKWKDINLAASDLFERIFAHRIGEYKPYRLKT